MNGYCFVSTVSLSTALNLYPLTYLNFWHQIRLMKICIPKREHLIFMSLQKNKQAENYPPIAQVQSLSENAFYAISNVRPVARLSRNVENCVWRATFQMWYRINALIKFVAISFVWKKRASVFIFTYVAPTFRRHFWVIHSYHC